MAGSGNNQQNGPVFNKIHKRGRESSDSSWPSTLFFYNSNIVLRVSLRKYVGFQQAPLYWFPLWFGQGQSIFTMIMADYF